MKTDRSLGLVVGLLVAAFGGCSGDKSGPIDGTDREEGGGGGNHVLAESVAARAHLAELQRFRWAVQEHGIDMPQRARLGNVASVPLPVIGTGIVEQFESVAGGRVRAVVSEQARRRVAKPARVELPLRASDPVHLEDNVRDDDRLRAGRCAR